MQRRTRHSAAAAAALALWLAAAPTHAANPELASLDVVWADQFGTSGFDVVDDVAADDGQAYAVGRVGFGLVLPGQSTSGEVDAFARSYLPSGEVAWTQQFGTSGFDGFTVAAATGSRVVVAGLTTGAFDGATNAGGGDVFVRTFTPGGEVLSTVQLGTSGFEFPLGVAADETASYLFGLTDGTWPGETAAGGQDFFLGRLDPAGHVEWMRQFGTSADDPPGFTLGGVDVDASGVYVTSTVREPLDGTTSVGDADAFVRKYSHAGDLLWTSRFGTACRDLASGLATFGGDVYVTGTTFGDMARPDQRRCTNPPQPYNNYGGGTSAFVRRIGPDGSPRWTTSYAEGVPAAVGFNLAIAIDVDETGAYIGGEAVRPRTGGIGDEPGSPTCPVASPREDVLVQQLAHDGSAGASVRFGSTGLDVPSGLAVGAGGIHVGGTTACEVLGGTSAGRNDAFMVRLE